MPISLSEIENLANAGQIARIDGERVTTLLPDNYLTARSVRILEEPDVGRLTVNPDNSLALVMSGTEFTGPLSFQVEVVNANGSVSRDTVDLRVDAPSQSAGWGLGTDQYMLETDSNGELVLETGENHREVYVSRDNDALTISDIAALEGVSQSTITGQWLENNREYGNNPNMALAQDAGALLWTRLTREDLGAEPSSHWLRLEKGYQYDTLDLFPPGLQGEDELHPIVITSYGQGTKPIITTDQYFIRNEFANIVVHDLHFTKKITLVEPSGTDSQNVILDSVSFSEQGGISAQGVDGLTVRDATFHNIGEDAPSNGRNWQASPDRDHGIYSSDASGVLIENSTFVQIGWGDGYDSSGNGNDPQPPSLFTHNVYMAASIRDLTFRDNISAEAASFGANLRSGGFVEDNMFFDNNGGVVVSGGNWSGSGQIGNFSLISGNVVTSAGYRDGGGAGALALGITNAAADTTLINNIVAHQTDPTDQGSQYDSNGGLNNNFDPFYNDTIVYEWYGQYAIERNQEASRQQNIDELNITRADNTTITNLARNLLNDPRADANDLADWLVENNVSADQLNAYFQQGFNVALPSRGSATDVRFVPTEISDGVRWDNRENWSTGDLAGTNVNDRVDLGGNWVVHNGTTTIRTLDFGSGGELESTQGRLNVSGQVTASAGGATLTLDAAGQFWMGGGYNSGAALDVVQDGGRFANTGVITGNVNLFVDDGQALLSAEGGDFVLGRGEALTIRGADAQVGFDGALNREGIIRFESGSDVVIASDGSGLGSISEFRSGAYNNAPRVDSNIHLGGTDLTVDLRAAGQPNGTYVLMSADEITGNLGSFSMEGLGNRSATLTINYNTDEVLLNISAGSGVRTQTVGSNTTPPPVAPPPEDDDIDEGPGTAPPNGMTAAIDAATSDLFIFTNPENLQDSYDGSISGGDANNTLIGTGGNDRFFAGDGDDIVTGNGGSDLVWGGLGEDRIFGNEGNDIIFSDRDDDYVEGGWGNDLIAGVGGNDQLFGGNGNDNINGGAGRDQINGGSGADILTGGGSSDVFIFARNGQDWNDVITDFRFDEDVLVLGNAGTGHLTLADVDVSDYKGSAVISHDDNYILLQGVGVNTIVNNAGAVFGDAGDLLFT